MFLITTLPAYFQVSLPIFRPFCTLISSRSPCLPIIQSCQFPSDHGAILTCNRPMTMTWIDLLKTPLSTPNSSLRMWWKNCEINLFIKVVFYCMLRWNKCNLDILLSSMFVGLEPECEKYICTVCLQKLHNYYICTNYVSIQQHILRIVNHQQVKIMYRSV